MAIGTPVILVAAYTTTDTTTYTVTPSPAPSRGRLLVLFHDTSHATLTAPTSTPTGLGLDWKLQGEQGHPTDVRRIFAHTAPVHAGLTTGNITLTMTGANLPSTGTGFALVQMSGVDLARPVVRVMSTNVNSTSITLTLPTPLSVANRWLVFKSHRANEVTTPRAAPWSELSDVGGASPTRAGQVQWLPGVVTSTGVLETAASASWATSGQGSIIALEMRAAQDRYAVFFGDTPQATVTQAAYRFYADGTETGATAVAAQDTSYSANIGGGDVDLQARIRLQNTSTVAASSGDDWQLQYQLNGGTWTDVVTLGTESLLDSYADTNRDAAQQVGTGIGANYTGQSFQGNDNKLSKVRWFVSKTGAPTGNMTAYLYAHSGTFGSGGLPTGSALATSATVDISTLSTSFAWKEFLFDSTVTLTSGTSYFMVVRFGPLDSSNFLNVGTDNSASTHAGNGTTSTNGSTWSAVGADRCFEVYTQAPATIVVPFSSANLTDTGATTERLTGGTGAFVAGEVSEDGLVNDLGWSASNYTELLYSLTLKSDDLVDGDDLLFRVKRNDVANLTYTATPTIAIATCVPVTTWPWVEPFAYTSGDLTATVPCRWATATGTMAGVALDGTSIQITGLHITVPAASYRMNTAVANLPTDDQYAELEVTLGNTNTQGMVQIRGDSTGQDGYQVWYYGDGASNYLVGLYRCNNGVLTSLDTDATVTGGTHTIEVRAVGNTITGWFDGSQVATATDSTYPTNRGSSILLNSADSTVSADNYEQGTAVAAITGTVAVTLAAFTSTATGTETITGTSAQTLAAFTSTATGVETISGTSAQTLADYTSTAAGTVIAPVTGTVAQTLADFTSTASGTHTVNITGTSAQTLAAFTSTSTGVETFTGTSAQTLAAFTSTATGSVAPAVTGTSAQTLTDFTSTATGLETITGTSAQTLAAFTSTASGVVAAGISGTVAQTLADYTSTATAVETITGTSAQTLAGHTSTAAGVVAQPVTGTSAQTLADFTSTASGLHQQNVAGTVAVTLADHTSTASGTETISGSSAQTLAAFTSTATGLETITGTSAQTLAAFTSTATGLETITGTVAVTLADFTSTASGVVQANITGTAATTLTGHTSTATGSVTNPITGTAAVTLDGHTSTAAGVETFIGTAAVTLEAFTSTAAGIVLTPIVGTAAVTLEDFYSTTTAAPIIATYGPLIRAARPATIQRTRPVVVTMRRPEDADRDRPVTVELARPGV